MFCAIVLQYNLLLIRETGQTRSHETSTVRLDRPPCNLTLITLVGLLQSRGPWPVPHPSSKYRKDFRQIQPPDVWKRLSLTAV